LSYLTASPEDVTFKKRAERRKDGEGNLDFTEEMSPHKAGGFYAVETEILKVNSTWGEITLKNNKRETTTEIPHGDLTRKSRRKRSYRWIMVSLQRGGGGAGRTLFASARLPDSDVNE